jgi:hypothetical protein
LPFRVFGVDCSTFRVAAWRRPLVEFAARSEYSARRSIALMGYAFPFCRWPLPQLYGFSSPGSTDCCSSNPFHPLVGFRVPPESCSVNLAVRPRPVGSSLGLLLPSALAGIEGPLLVSVPHSLPFRLQGLVTLLTACSLRSLVDPVSDRQRSWDSPFGAILPSVRSRVTT